MVEIVSSFLLDSAVNLSAADPFSRLQRESILWLEKDGELSSPSLLGAVRMGAKGTHSRSIWEGGSQVTHGYR